ncbi:MAG TPA: hypothetical protein PKW63_05360 [Vicinamibacterales bacterium]|nr:hypothetical protein [Vicinamibacterales bacterium]
MDVQRAKRKTWEFAERKEMRHTQGADSYGASLARISAVRDNRRAAVTQVTSSSTLVRFKETINGRAYVIEASAVARDRWRAQIVRLPGGRAALMPFYGATPDEAAGQLSAWLTRASRTQ